jgi:hypothetical protein
MSIQDILAFILAYEIIRYSVLSFIGKNENMRNPKPCACGNTSNPQGYCDGTHSK